MPLDIKDTSVAIEADFGSDKSAVSSIFLGKKQFYYKCQMLSLKAMHIIAAKGTTLTIDRYSLYVLLDYVIFSRDFHNLFYFFIISPFHNSFVQIHVHIICAQIWICTCKR